MRRFPPSLRETGLCIRGLEPCISNEIPCITASSFYRVMLRTHLLPFVSKLICIGFYTELSATKLKGLHQPMHRTGAVLLPSKSSKLPVSKHLIGNTIEVSHRIFTTILIHMRHVNVVVVYPNVGHRVVIQLYPIFMGKVDSLPDALFNVNHDIKKFSLHYNNTTHTRRGQLCSECTINQDLGPALYYYSGALHHREQGTIKYPSSTLC